MDLVFFWNVRVHFSITDTGPPPSTMALWQLIFVRKRRLPPRKVSKICSQTIPLIYLVAPFFSYVYRKYTLSFPLCLSYYIAGACTSWLFRLQSKMSKCLHLKNWPVKGLCGRCLSEFVDWRSSQSWCSYFRLSFVNCCPSNLLSHSLHI
jgi:hypothetical protein